MDKRKSYVLGKMGKTLPRKSLAKWYKDNVTKSKYSTQIEVGYCYSIKEVEEV